MSTSSFNISSHSDNKQPNKSNHPIKNPLATSAHCHPHTPETERTKKNPRTPHGFFASACSVKFYFSPPLPAVRGASGREFMTAWKLKIAFYVAAIAAAR